MNERKIEWKKKRTKKERESKQKNKWTKERILLITGLVSLYKLDKREHIKEKEQTNNRKKIKWKKARNKIKIKNEWKK